jgi:hypothetical protein
VSSTDRETWRWGRSTTWGHTPNATCRRSGSAERVHTFEKADHTLIPNTTSERGEQALLLCTCRHSATNYPTAPLRWPCPRSRLGHPKAVLTQSLRRVSDANPVWASVSQPPCFHRVPDRPPPPDGPGLPETPHAQRVAPWRSDPTASRPSRKRGRAVLHTCGRVNHGTPAAKTLAPG